MSELMTSPSMSDFANCFADCIAEVERARTPGSPPWQARAHQDVIELRLDHPSPRDDDAARHAAVLACGRAAFDFQLALRSRGHAVRITRLPYGPGSPLVVCLSPDGACAPTPLELARHAALTGTTAYSRAELLRGASPRQFLIDAARKERTWLGWVTDPDDVRLLARAIGEQTRPEQESWALLGALGDAVRDHLRAGEAPLQSVLLSASAIGVPASAYCLSPVENPLRSELCRAAQWWGYPQAVLRFGRRPLTMAP